LILFYFFLYLKPNEVIIHKELIETEVHNQIKN
jgi:hypothetical protein